MSLLLLFVLPTFTLAQNNQLTPPKEETIEAVVTKVTEGKIIESDGKEQLHQTLELTVTEGTGNVEQHLLN